MYVPLFHALHRHTCCTICIKRYSTPVMLAWTIELSFRTTQWYCAVWEYSNVNKCAVASTTNDSSSAHIEFMRLNLQSVQHLGTDIVCRELYLAAWQWYHLHALHKATTSRIQCCRSVSAIARAIAVRQVYSHLQHASAALNQVSGTVNWCYN
jgi:hypothetical protein